MRRLILAAVLSAVLSACFTAPWKIERKGDALPDGERARLCERLKTRAQSIQSLRLLYSTALEHDSERVEFRTLVVYRAPKAMRLESLPTQGAYSLALVVLGDEAGVAINPSEKKAVRASDDKVLLDELWPGFGFSRGEILDLVLGNAANACDGDPLALFATGTANGRTLVDLPTNSEWELDEKYRLLRSVWRDDTSPASPLFVEYLEYTADSASGVGIPRTIRISVPRGPATLELRLDREQVNPEIADAIFTVAVPESYSVITR